MAERLPDDKNNQKKPRKSDIALLIALVLLSVIVFGFYRFLMNYYYFEIVLIAYMAIETVFIIVYVLYNRGFSRRGVTTEMLPETWSEEKKEEFISNGARRMRRSRWMLVVIIAFLITFAIDIIELVVMPTLFGWFGV